MGIGIFYGWGTLGTTGFTSMQLTRLQDLANQCPYLGGTAVFKARAMLGGDVSYNDKLLCQTGGSLLKKPNNGLQTSSFVAYPNPAKKELNLSFEAREKQGLLEVLDLFGRQVETHKIPEGTVSLVLQTESWHNGMYLLRFSFDSEQSATKSIIIAH